MQALYGRNGESPVAVVGSCVADRLLHHGIRGLPYSRRAHDPGHTSQRCVYRQRGSSAWRVPEADEYPQIKTPDVPADELANHSWHAYERRENLGRYWPVGGTEGAAHRLGGLEKDSVTGAISNDPANHEKMVMLRREKIARIADDIPALELLGDKDADTLLIGWGGTYGHLRSAVDELNAAGRRVALAHFRYINPLPKNTGEVLARYSRIIVAELNTGMFADYLQCRYPDAHILRINKIQGQPFAVSEIVDRVTKYMEED